MSKSQDLRKRAEQARRASETQTYGDRTIDRELRSLAEKFEQEAEALDQTTKTRKP